MQCRWADIHNRFGILELVVQQLRYLRKGLHIRPLFPVDASLTNVWNDLQWLISCMSSYPTCMLGKIWYQQHVTSATINPRIPFSARLSQCYVTCHESSVPNNLYENLILLSSWCLVRWLSVSVMGVVGHWWQTCRWSKLNTLLVITKQQFLVQCTTARDKNSRATVLHHS